MGHCVGKTCLLLVCIFFEAKASTEQTNVSETKTNYAVSHISKLMPELKQNLNEVDTFAKLQHDPRANLSASFTICSTIMAHFLTYPLGMIFFNLLDIHEVPVALFEPLLNTRETVEGIATTFFFSTAVGKDGKTPHAFPHKWIKGCVAYNRELAQIQWVVDGSFVANLTYSKKESALISTDLSGKLVLGVFRSRGGWNAVPNKVTNLNVFSTAHSVEVMEQNTQGEECIEDGDYLAWKDMQWTLYGEARIETVPIEEPCIGDPVFDIYDLQGEPNSLQNPEGCINLCENLGSQAPSFATIEE